jgi:hypothetical protein
MIQKKKELEAKNREKLLESTEMMKCTFNPFHGKILDKK